MESTNRNTNQELQDMSVEELKLELSGEFDPSLISEINSLIMVKSGDQYAILQ